MCVARRVGVTRSIHHWRRPLGRRREPKTRSSLYIYILSLSAVPTNSSIPLTRVKLLTPGRYVSARIDTWQRDRRPTRAGERESRLDGRRCLSPASGIKHLYPRRRRCSTFSLLGVVLKVETVIRPLWKFCCWPPFFLCCCHCRARWLPCENVNTT